MHTQRHAELAAELPSHQKLTANISSTLVHWRYKHFVISVDLAAEA